MPMYKINNKTYARSQYRREHSSNYYDNGGDFLEFIKAVVLITFISCSFTGIFAWLNYPFQHAAKVIDFGMTAASSFQEYHVHHGTTTIGKITVPKTRYSWDTIYSNVNEAHGHDVRECTYNREVTDSGRERWVCDKSYGISVVFTTDRGDTKIVSCLLDAATWKDMRLDEEVAITETRSGVIECP